MTDRLLTVEEVADIVGCSVRTVRRWIADGVLGSVKIGGLRRVCESALVQFAGLESTDWGALAEDDVGASGHPDPVTDRGSDG